MRTGTLYVGAAPAGHGGPTLPVEALTDPERVEAAVAGCDAVVHAGALETEDLESVMQGTYLLTRAAVAAGVRRLVVVSTLDLFDRLPENWIVDFRWRPRPRPTVEHLRAWLAEISAREGTRETAMQGVVLRFGRVGAQERSAALRAALTDDFGPHFWAVRHVGARPAAPAEERPWRDVLVPPAPMPSRPIRNVVLFGAAGPMAAEVYRRLKGRYRLRLADIQSTATVAARGYPHQPTGSPLPEPPVAPHEEVHCDVTDPAQVLAACDGMDAILNCSVIRYRPQDFAVNALGPYHMAQAALAQNIRRIVQTGPQIIGLDKRIGYHYDYDVPGDAPPRPGWDSYGHSKYLGNEILRVFAEWYDLEVPVLLFNNFITPTLRTLDHPEHFGTTFEEAAEAVARALDLEALSSPYETAVVCADLPHGRYSAERCRRLLGWAPGDALEAIWKRGGA